MSDTVPFARGLRSWVIVALGVLWLGAPQAAYAQLGALVSPGRLARAHADLEGIGNCSKCHEQGRKVTAQKCLACHAPIAQRIARKTGVHRGVTTDCVTCHAEHAGPDGQLRPFETKGFNHATDAGFALDGKHVPLACTACHPSRSYLTASASCNSCHTDTHKGTLGANCASCHSTTVAFKAAVTQFDHSKAAFRLAGAHAKVSCASCHVNQVFKGVKFQSCTDCHRDPHQKRFGATCTSCHDNDSWRTRRVGHSQTAFPLVGKHESVSCVACHKQPAMKVALRPTGCASCHADVHRGTFAQDCKSCHSESGWAQAPFDHGTTAFALTGKHETTACAACHTATSAAAAAPAASRIVDFRGLRTACGSCHADVHEGELGARCESCHSSATFRVPSYRHARSTAFFGGQHQSVACEKCHAPGSLTAPVRTGAPLPLSVKFTRATTACVTCHEDVHLGQQGDACETCHSVDVPRFAVNDFSHATKTTYPLIGRHQAVACVACHKPETGLFPARTGTAVRYKGLGRECRACHEDVHLGQLGPQCEGCHQEASFKLPGYVHRNKAVASFFTGKHARATCEACHKTETGRFPGGAGTAIRFAVNTTCVSCHTDVHRGALGPNCGTCHRP